MSAAPIRKCPECGKNKVKRLISTGAGLIFKGSGFYITDYRSEGYKSAAKADSGSEGKSESKPATGDAAAGKPAESKPAESKPAESKPAASKPAEKKPSGGAKRK